MASIQCSFARIEKKYLLTRAQYLRILPTLQARTEPDEFGQYTICSIYYDTPDFALIRASLEKPVYKEKLRLRSYGVPTDDARASACSRSPSPKTSTMTACSTTCSRSIWTHMRSIRSARPAWARSTSCTTA